MGALPRSSAALLDAQSPAGVPDPRRLLRSQPCVQCRHVELVHGGADAGGVDDQGGDYQYECEFHAHGVCGVDGVWGGVAGVVVGWGGGAGGGECGDWEEGGGGEEGRWWGVGEGGWRGGMGEGGVG